MTETSAQESSNPFRHTRELMLLGVRVVIIGTAHVSKESVRDVESLIRELRPQGVFLELCRSRVQLLSMPMQPTTPPGESNGAGGAAGAGVGRDGSSLSVAALQDAYRTGGSVGVLQTVLATFMADVAKKIGGDAIPGQEFAAAARASKECGSFVCLGDRDVSVTLKRAWGALTLWEKVRLIYGLAMESLDDITSEDLEKLKENDMLTALIKEVAEEFPNLLEPLLNERDRYMSFTLRNFCGVLRQRAPPTMPLTVVAVIGMGHMNGLEKALETPVTEEDFQIISQPPPTRTWTQFLVRYVAVPCGIVTVGYFAAKKFRPSFKLL